MKQKKILISIILFFILIIILYLLKNENFTTQVSTTEQSTTEQSQVSTNNSGIDLGEWDPYGNTHNQCIQKCYNETDENKQTDRGNGKITDIYDGNNLSTIDSEEQPGFNTIHSELDYLQFSNLGFNKLNLKGKELEEYLHNYWKYIKNPLSDYSITNKEKTERSPGDAGYLTSETGLEKYSECFKKCFDCNEKTVCKFKSFNNDDIYVNKTININVIPYDKKITLIWKLNFSSNVKKFILTIKEKTVDNIVKTIEIPNNDILPQYIKSIQNLKNNVIYIININAIENDGNIFHSKSIEVMPNDISSEGYSKILNLQKINKNKSLLDFFKGKILNINIE